MVNTIFYLDAKDGFLRIPYSGNYICEGDYLEQRYEDITQPFGELVPNNRRYEFVEEEYHLLPDGNYEKNLFYKEG